MYDQESTPEDASAREVWAPRRVDYNYLHDLESVWWIAVWTLFNFEKKDSGTDEINSCATKQSRLNNDKLFSRTNPNTDRSDFLSKTDTYGEDTQCLPKYFGNFVLRLLEIGNAITAVYRKKSLDETYDVLWGESFAIYETFIRLLSRVEMKQFEIVGITWN